MSTEIERLKRQARELQREIDKLHRESEEREKRFRQEYQRNMKALQDSMKQALDNHDAYRVRDWQKKIDDLNRELLQRIDENHRNLRAMLEDELEVRHQNILQQIETYYEEIQRKYEDEIVSTLAETDAKKLRTAQNEYATAAMKYTELSSRAHEQLFPGQLVIYGKTLEQAKTMQQQKQLEASIATSVMLATKLKKFELDIRDALKEWMQSYSKMKNAYETLNERLQNRILNIDGERINEDTAMHWTEHKFDDIFGLMAECSRVVEELNRRIRQSGENVLTIEVVEQYIKTGNAPNKKKLDEYLKALKYEIPGRLKDLEAELHSAYKCSFQRKRWADGIVAYMTAKHNTGAPVYNGFEDDRTDKKSNYLLEFRQPAGMGKFYKYEIHIVPVIVNGVTENHIRMYMDYTSGTETYQTKLQNRYVMELLKAIKEKRAVIAVGSDKEVLDGNADEEYSIQPAVKGKPESLVKHNKNTA